MIDSLGDVGAALGNAQPDRMGQLYADLRLQLRYEQPEQAVIVTASPVWLVRVSEGGLEPPRPVKGTSTSS